MAAGIELAPLITKLKVDTDQFKKDMADAAKLGKGEAEKVEKSMDGLMKTGEKLGKAGDMLTKRVTLPVVGIGVATSKMAVDFESSFAKVSTLLDEGVVNFDEYKEELIKGSNETKTAVDEYSESVYQAISAGVDQTKAVGFTTDAMKLAKGGFTSGASAVDILTTAINGYNLSAEDATKISDMLITTQNLGKTTVDELSSSMGKVIPIASSVNFGMNELSASYAQLTKNGIATAEAGTYLKQMLSELGKTGSISDKALRELTGKGFADLKKEGKATSDILQLMSEYAKANDMTLKDMFGSVEAGSAALVLSKGKGKEYNEMLDAMNRSAGATQKAFEKMDATPAEKMKGALNELRNEGVKFGALFVPVITKTADRIGGLADDFGNLSDEQKKNILQWAALAAVAGPALKVIGGGITTFSKLSSVMSGMSTIVGETGGIGLVSNLGSLASICAPLAIGAAAVGTGIYAIHENAQLMNRTVLETSDKMSGMEKIMAKLNGVEIKTREELENLGLVHREFSEEISKEFQKEVEQSTEKLQKFGMFLREIGFDDVIDQNESAEFNRRINEMCDEAIATIRSKKEESQKGLKELFVVDDGVIDEGEQKVLEILSKSSNEQIEEIERLKEEILKIKQKAVDDGRALNEREIADVEEKSARIRQIELESLGGTQEEIEYAKNEFTARVKTMDAESASELLQQKIKARDEELVQIQAGYDTQIDMLKTKLADCKEEDRKAISDQIANLQKDKEDKIKIQEDLYDEYLGIIKDKNPEILDVINEYNGKILTQEEKKSIEILKKQKTHYADLDQITKDGYYDVYNTVTKQMETIVVDVDEKTGEIIGIMDSATGEVGAYTGKVSDHVRNMAKSYTSSYEAIVGDHMKYVDSTGNVLDANGNVVASMDEVKKHTDGTREGIVNINGTPYNIKVNKDNTISDLKKISSEADYATRARTIKITAYADVGATAGRAAASAIPRTHYNGLDNVPYDGYRAVLHKNERVLTAEENQEYPMKERGGTKNGKPSILRATINIGRQNIADVLIPIVEDAMTLNAELKESGA